MAIRRPLVMIAGVEYELVDGDTFPALPSVSAGFVDLTDAAPATPPADTVRLFRRSLAGRQMPAFSGPSGIQTRLQPFLGRNKVGRVSPSGGGTVVSIDGLPNLTVVGTATGRTPTNTSLFTRMRRVGYVSAATAAAFSSIRINNNLFSVGTGTGLGGFALCTRFGFSDAVLVTDARSFIGMDTALAAAANVEPSTLLNSIGVGHGAADANLKIFYGGSAAQPPIDLGASFPKSLSIPYELALFAPPDTANTVHWEVTRLDTGMTATGTITGGAAVIPQSTVFMTGIKQWRCNNATAAAVGLDLINYYIETDD